MKLLYLLNMLRTLPCYLLIKLTGTQSVLEADMHKFLWYIGVSTGGGQLHDDCLRGVFVRYLNRLLLRNRCFRNVVVYRVSCRKKVLGLCIRLLFPIKQDLELHGQIGEGLAIYHGHGTIVNAHSVGKNFSVYQGVTIGKNPKPGKEIIMPIIGDNVTVYANAVVAGGITIGDNVSIGAGAVVMKDVPADSVVIGNPCIIKPKK